MINVKSFCRHCQKPDYCRADYHKWAVSYHCNKKRGHVSKNCDRNNSEAVPSKVRVVERTAPKAKERKGAKPTPPFPKRETAGQRSHQAEEKDHSMPDAPSSPTGPLASDSQLSPSSSAEDMVMGDTSMATTRISDADALNSVSRDIQTPRTEFNPSRAAKKLIRLDGSSDIGDARYTNIDQTNVQTDTRHPTNENDRTSTPPAHSGTQNPTNL
ncbi:hypothetical protein MAM1_0038c02784 [Mucor ambiguus]|uniref:CCHC-type domain-containing protein n=1 Tax=Mucor ambiguus TaxID=91626 RepID=A0A0C9M370_9FUNG|nr:hypothetical protein MAM1_0038c02784 [Mucor ambiguus]